MISPEKGKPSKRQAHDISGGIDLTGGQLDIFRTIFYTIIGWFSITIEALLRRNFGERYYTPGNFFIGFWILTAFFSLSFMAGSFGSQSATANYSITSWVIWLGYIFLSMFHFWKIWVNAQIGQPEHSLYDGKSHLQPLGRILLKFVNPLTASVAKILGGITLNSKNSALLNASLQRFLVFSDEEKFTKMWVEPAFLLLVWAIVPDIPNFWMFICLVAHLVFTRMRYANKRNGELNITDGVIDAAQMKEDKEFQERLRMETRGAVTALKKRIEEEPEYIEEIKEGNPDLMDTLAELDIDLGAKDL